MRQRRAHAKVKARVTRDREDSLFFGRGEFPASARAFSQCSCGARAFTRGADNVEFSQDFYDAHAWCDEDLSAGAR